MFKKISIYLYGMGIVLGGLMPFSFVYAQELYQDIQETVRAKVITIVTDEMREISGTDTPTVYQKLLVEVLEGEASGKEVSVENDYVRVSEGDTVYIHRLVTIEGSELYLFSEPDRTFPLLFFSLLFVVVIFMFGGVQGVRGLFSLCGSLALIIFVLLPALSIGWSPLLVAISVSSLIIVLGSYITHGFTRTTSSAVLGMICTVIITGTLAYISVEWGKLTGFSDEGATFVNLNSKGMIDISGLLLGGMLIGLLGVLYDSAIGQAVAVDELYRTAPHLSRQEVFKKATRIGREHIGALVTSLAIAYVGASLSLLLLFYTSGSSWIEHINREVFATEIMRTLVGSIGLVIAVPITTCISVFMLVRKSRDGITPPQDSKVVHSHSHIHR
ncbi:MAG TPA: YibE/F family protein [Candidatus Paceibacterota bacterium]|nr:YibE/F family protein [Candidatus Paceibacterota bacterium]